MKIQIKNVYKKVFESLAEKLEVFFKWDFKYWKLSFKKVALNPTSTK